MASRVLVDELEQCRQELESQVLVSGCCFVVLAVLVVLVVVVVDCLNFF